MALIKSLAFWTIVLITTFFIDNLALLVAFLYTVFLLITSYKDYKIVFKSNSIIFYTFFSSNEVNLNNIKKIVIEAPFSYGRMFDTGQHVSIHCLDNEVITFNLYNFDRENLIKDLFQIAKDNDLEIINNSIK